MSISAPTTESRLAEAIETLAKLQQTQADNAPRRRLTYAEWAARQPKHVMPFPVYQNGYKIFASQLPKEAIALLPALQEGRFFNRRIHVYRDQTPDRAWHIDYPSRQLTDRMTMSTYGADIVEILKKLTTETPDLT